MRHISRVNKEEVLWIRRHFVEICLILQFWRRSCFIFAEMFQPGASLCARMLHRSWEPSVFFQMTARFQWHADGVRVVGEINSIT